MLILCIKKYKIIFGLMLETKINDLISLNLFTTSFCKLYHYMVQFWTSVNAVSESHHYLVSRILHREG